MKLKHRVTPLLVIVVVTGEAETISHHYFCFARTTQTPILKAILLWLPVKPYTPVNNHRLKQRKQQR